jgi:GNAT superfamily N-acetyltransferase
MFRRHITVHEELPREKLQNLKFVYIIVDSNGKTHYEFNNKGHIVLPIHWSEMNPLRITKNLPRNLVRKCVSNKSDLAGVLQLWIYYTQDHIYARIKGMGILAKYQGQGLSKILLIAMDAFCEHYDIEWIECESWNLTSEMLAKEGFERARSRRFFACLEQFITRAKSYVKYYR